MNKSKSTSPLAIAGYLVALLLLVALAWQMAGQPSRPTPLTIPVAEEKAGADSQTPTVATQAPLAAPPSVEPEVQPEANNLTQTAPPPSPLDLQQEKDEQARTEADFRIGNIINENATVEAAREKLLNLFPTFNTHEKIMAAPHLVNLVEDEQLPQLVKHLMNPLTPQEAQETIFNDMLNRQPQLGWPVLVDILAQPKHPMAERSRELLTTIVGEDHGNNISAWKEALNKQLIDQGALPGAEEQASAPQQ
jgi:hypothetical protein